MDKKLEATLKRRASGELRLDVKGLQKKLLETPDPSDDEPAAPSTVTVRNPSINPPPRRSVVYVDTGNEVGWDDWEEKTGS